ncbi:hypothetical protein [Streptomyces sp. NPDC051183]
MHDIQEELDWRSYNLVMGAPPLWLAGVEEEEERADPHIVRGID